VVEPSCAGIVAAYAVAACTVGLAVGVGAGVLAARRTLAPPLEPTGGELPTEVIDIDALAAEQ
ncbi:unnamed protein product, partial [Prorocentrum cordatum]